MQQFLFRRIGFAFLALFVLSILTFMLVRPERYDVRYVWGEPGSRMVEERQLVVQYARYMNDLFQGNWEKAWGLERLSTTFRLGRTCTGVECRPWHNPGSSSSHKQGHSL